jgi:hypothetical protein
MNEVVEWKSYAQLIADHALLELGVLEISS